MLKKIFLVAVFAFAGGAAFSQTENDKLSRNPQDVQQINTDVCAPNCTITINGTTDGNVLVRPGETKYFRISKSACTWQCCDNKGFANLRAGVIQIKRQGDRISFSFVAQPRY